MGYTVALTGGIGSGKSTIANIFFQLGIAIIDSDVIARQMVAPGTPIFKSITKRFSGQMIKPDGTLNRRALRERIFSFPNDKNWLNALLHPLIYQEAQQQIVKAKSPYRLWVVPLLIENQLYERVDRILVVDVNPEKQIQRIIQRDNVSRLHAECILSAQVSRQVRLSLADDVIDNNGMLDSTLLLNISRLHAKYLEFANQNFHKRRKNTFFL